MEPLRSRIPAALTTAALALSLTACGDGDGNGAAEGVDKAKDKIEREGGKLKRDAEKQGRELRDDVQESRKKKGRN